MALTDLLGSALRGAALGLAMYVAGCGNDSEKEGCQDDYDCREPRVCVQGYCEGGNGDNDGNGSCGNSPLVGKYLWLVDNCQGGSVRPFDTSCQGTLELVDGKRVDIEYSGTTLRLGSQRIELRRMITESDLSPDDVCGSFNSDFSRYQCALSQDKQLYLAFTSENEKRCLEDYSTLFKIEDEPWPGRASCLQIITDEAWFTECFSQEN